jgi:hypothetical protein
METYPFGEQECRLPDDKRRAGDPARKMALAGSSIKESFARRNFTDTIATPSKAIHIKRRICERYA